MRLYNQRMRRASLLALLTLALGMASACVTTRAQAPIVMQPLEVPPVPPRVIVPDIEEVEMTPEAAPRPSQPRASETPAKPPEKAVEPPKTGAQEPPKPEDAPRVRTPSTANNEVAEREVRAIMGRAQGTLQTVNYRGLSAAARQQYDTARRFIAQAESALKVRNYVFARNLADKAETLARQLGK